MGTPLLTSECHGHHHQDKCQGIMALYHFKKDVINSNEQSNSSNNSGNLFQQNDSKSGKSGGFSSNSNSSVFPSSSSNSSFLPSSSQSHFNCRNCQQRSGENSVMLNRVNLGDVLRETISNEMRSIMRENGQNCLRFGGS